MSQSLISIVSEATKLEMMIIESSGEVTPDIESALAVNEKSLAEKVDSYDHILKRMESLEAHYKSQAEFYSTISKQCKNAKDRLKDNLKYAMEQLGVDEIHGIDVRFKKTATTGSIEITDEELIPVEYKSEVITTEIDKKKLKDDLKTKEIPGVKFIPGFSLKTYANTSKKAVK